jgi:hypothetical protein
MDELGGIGSQPRGEQQIAVMVGEGRIDERPGRAVQRIPRDESGIGEIHGAGRVR